jgi:uncharacterized protein YdeI (YjbR/CyaY-like superfamily)
MNPKVDFFFDKATTWQPEYRALRKIVLASGLSEELKWGKPCYTVEGNNVALIHGFKEYCALLLMKGALMKDPNALLIQQTENVQSARQLRFVSEADIVSKKALIQAYLAEAIALEKAGAKVIFKKELAPLPEELQDAFKKTPALKKAFAALTPGRQRGYVLYFGSAKQAKTRVARILKSASAIMAGKGIDE